MAGARMDGVTVAGRMLEFEAVGVAAAAGVLSVLAAAAPLPGAAAGLVA